MTGATQGGGDADWKVVDPTDNARLRLYSPVLGNTCTRCVEQIDDLSFVIEREGGERRAGGLCASCLVEVLGQFASPRS